METKSAETRQYCESRSDYLKKKIDRDDTSNLTMDQYYDFMKCKGYKIHITQSYCDTIPEHIKSAINDGSDETDQKDKRFVGMDDSDMHDYLECKFFPNNKLNIMTTSGGPTYYYEYDKWTNYKNNLALPDIGCDSWWINRGFGKGGSDKHFMLKNNVLNRHDCKR